MSRSPLRLLASLLVAGVLVHAGCGGDEAGDGAPGSAADATRPTPEALLADLAGRVARGEGISDESWTRAVQEVAMALWPVGDSEVQLLARRDHTNLAHIAGDMAVQLAAGPDARTEWMERDPGSVEIHDAFVAEAGKGPDVYGAWVTGAGHDLLEARIRALMGDGPR